MTLFSHVEYLELFRQEDVGEGAWRQEIPSW